MKKGLSCAAMAAFIAIAALTLSGCDGEYTPLERFDSYLRASWVSARTLSFWETEDDRGRLVIGYDAITISGPVSPFDTDYPSGYTRDIALKGYSEESSSAVDEKRGTLFIRDKGALKHVPYLRWRAAGEYLLTVGTVPHDETFRQE